MNRVEVEETVRLMRQIAAHRERAERYELAWTSARRRALGRFEVIRRLRGQLAEVYAVSAVERRQLDEARARANEAARLSAEARDRADDQDKVIADLREQVSIVDSDRLTYDAWALNVLTEHGLTYDIADLRTPIADYLRALTAERDRLGEQAQHLVNRCAEFRGERDEARAEVERLGQENDELRRTIRNLSEAYHASTVAAATDRLRAALDEQRIEPEPIDLERFDSGAYTTPVSEERIQRVIAAAGLDEGAFRRESLGEWPLDPEPGCPAHGAHPHAGRRCLDCPACVGELRTEGEAG